MQPSAFRSLEEVDCRLSTRVFAIKQLATITRIVCNRVSKELQVYSQLVSSAGEWTTLPMSELS
jgi:hypothetical protein